MSTGLISVLAAAVSYGVLRLLLARPGLLPPALPNHRSLHSVPTPQGAGIAIWCGLAVATAISTKFPDWALPLLAVAAISAWDDYRGVPAMWRLAVQLGAAALWIGTGWPLMTAACACLVILWAANLFNFMDGSDGLAGITAWVGFGAYAVAAWSAGGDFPPPLYVVAALAPVLWMNWPRARVFLGDSGSVPLGFLAAVLGIDGWRSGLWPAWFPLCVFLPFIVDATATLARRALRGDRVWQPHREHFYQRLVQLGAGHEGTLAVYGLLAGVGGVAALGALAVAPRVPWLGPALTLAWLFVIGAIFAVVDHQWRKQGLLA